MYAEKAVRARLLADLEVFGLVGSRIYPVVIPQASTYPAIAYQRISGVHEQSQDGLSGLEHPRIQVSCYGNEYAEGQRLAEAVKLAMIPQRSGESSGFPYSAGNVEVQGVALEDDADLFELTEGEGAPRQIGVALDFEVWATETTN